MSGDSCAYCGDVAGIGLRDSNGIGSIDPLIGKMKQQVEYAISFDKLDEQFLDLRAYSGQ